MNCWCNDSQNLKWDPKTIDEATESCKAYKGLRKAGQDGYWLTMGTKEKGG
jgi:hypothetical protein